MKAHLEKALESGRRVNVYLRGDDKCFHGEVLEVKNGVVVLRCYSAQEDDESYGDEALAIIEIYRITVRHCDVDAAHLNRCMDV